MLYKCRLGALQYVHGNDLENPTTSKEKKLEADYVDNFFEAIRNGTEFPPAPNKKQYAIWDKTFPKQ